LPSILPKSSKDPFSYIVSAERRYLYKNLRSDYLNQAHIDFQYSKEITKSERRK